MNKNIFGTILIFSLISTIAVFLSIFLWAFNNDYVLYNVNIQAEGLKNSSIIGQGDLDYIEEFGNEHASLDLYFDEWWLLSFMVMLGSTLFVSYYSREAGLFSFLNLLFYGSMVFLLAVSIVDQLNTYLIEDLFYKLLPVAEGLMPMYEYYIAHIGMVSFVHFLACLGANRFYFKFKEFTKKTGSEFSDNEVV